ncbi:MAG TPA: TonB-dependent receptor, partial [Steroidobacteraceae bacterium]
MRTAVIATAVSLAIVGLSVAADAGAAIRMPTDIPAQPLRPALQLLSRQRNFQLIFRTDLVGDLQTQGAVGELTVDEALTQLLSGTGLTFQYLDEKTITITKARNGAESASRSGSARSLFRLAQAPSGEQGHSEKTESMHPVEGPGSSDSRAAHERNPQPSGKEALEEIVVTGTHIRGERPVGANLIVIGREEIDRSGHTTVQSIVQALPQNFMGGGANEGTRIGGGPINVNSSAASSINLRGLGPGSTLVLLNGRRLAPAGSDASFVDVANLPASAIDRIEVLLDGASAIYGTDAVGGVVNVILKRDFEGAETRAHGGVPTQGAAREYSIGQAFGAAWQTGHALVTYDYHQRNSLPARERPFTASQDLRPWGGSDFRDTRGNPGTIVIGTQSWAIPPNQDGSALMAESLTAGTRNLYNLNETREQLPEQTLHSLFGSIRQAAGERLELTADW